MIDILTPLCKSFPYILLKNTDKFQEERSIMNKLILITILFSFSNLAWSKYVNSYPGSTSSVPGSGDVSNYGDGGNGGGNAMPEVPVFDIDGINTEHRPLFRSLLIDGEIRPKHTSNSKISRDSLEVDDFSVSSQVLSKCEKAKSMSNCKKSNNFCGNTSLQKTFCTNPSLRYMTRQNCSQIIKNTCTNSDQLCDKKKSGFEIGLYTENPNKDLAKPLKATLSYVPTCDDNLNKILEKLYQKQPVLAAGFHNFLKHYRSEEVSIKKPYRFFNRKSSDLPLEIKKRTPLNCINSAQLSYRIKKNRDSRITYYIDPQIERKLKRETPAHLCSRAISHLWAKDFLQKDEDVKKLIDYLHSSDFHSDEPKKSVSEFLPDSLNKAFDLDLIKTSKKLGEVNIGKIDCISKFKTLEGVLNFFRENNSLYYQMLHDRYGIEILSK